MYRQFVYSMMQLLDGHISLVFFFILGILGVQVGGIVPSYPTCARARHFLLVCFNHGTPGHLHKRVHDRLRDLEPSYTAQSVRFG